MSAIERGDSGMCGTCLAACNHDNAPCPFCSPCEHVSGVRHCPRCGPVVWEIIRDVDHLAAVCPRCGRGYDIGWSTKGYETFGDSS